MPCRPESVCSWPSAVSVSAPCTGFKNSIEQPAATVGTLWLLQAKANVESARVEAQKIIADLKKGAKFEDIAKKQSKDPGSGANGGDLDWANAGSYVKEFSDAMVKLNKGQLTDAPVKSQFGFHVIRLDDVREAQLPKLEEVKPQIAQQLQQTKLGKFQDDLRAKAKIE